MFLLSLSGVCIFQGFVGLVINKRIVVAVTKQMEQGKAGFFCGVFGWDIFGTSFHFINLFALFTPTSHVRHCFPFSSVALIKCYLGIDT